MLFLVYIFLSKINVFKKHRVKYYISMKLKNTSQTLKYINIVKIKLIKTKMIR